MAKSNKRIVILGLSIFAVLVSTVLFSAGGSRFFRSAEAQRKPKNPKHVTQKDAQEFESRFPQTDYDAPEPTNPEEKLKRRIRNKRYDRRNLVMSNPPDSGAGVIVHSEVFSALPALPVGESDAILTADVLNSEAHLSNDKSGVYSEFNVQIDEVLKGTIPTLSQANLISVSRLGGMVRYPSGHKELYGVAEQNMPTSGRRYLFFLKAIEGNYEIVTAYEIGEKGVVALDFPPQFQALNSADSAAFLNTVRNAVANKN